MNRAFIGNENTVRVLNAALTNAGPSSAYLFLGPDSVGKRALAFQFLEAILCERPLGLTPCTACASCLDWRSHLHPDVHHIDLERTQHISIDHIRSLQHALRLKPVRSKHRVALIHYADMLTIEAANALLKTLEEPPQNTVIVVTANHAAQLPATVRSRCQIIHFHLVPTDLIARSLESQTDHATAENIAHISMGRPGIAYALIESPDEYKHYQSRVEKILEFMNEPLVSRLRQLPALLPKKDEPPQMLLPYLDMWVWLIRDAILISLSCQSFVVHRFLTESLQRFAVKHSQQHLRGMLSAVRAAKRDIEHNVNPQMALEQLCFSI